MIEDLRSTTSVQTGTAPGLSVEDLFEKHYDAVYRYLYYRVGDRATAEDLASEVFLRLIGALPGYKAGPVSVRAWVFQIARNLAIDHFRRASLRQDLRLLENIPAEGNDPQENLELGLTITKLSNALALLPENQREVVILRFVVALPLAEVAIMLHKSEDAVKGLQRRALSALREILTEWEVVHV
jgi:RNA polymerase sigma-70 factor (ECF subfamily)